MVIETDTGEQIEVYRNQIERIASEYINELADASSIHESNAFRGLLKRIYKEVFRAPTTQLHNTKTIVNLDDVELLYQLWDTFTTLCYQFGHCPTIGKFSLMIGVSPVTFANWSAERSRNKTLSHFKAIKDFKAECESALEDRTIQSNSIGSIFALKSSYQWREAAPVQTEESYITATQSPEQIAERYKNAERPQLEELE